MLPNELLFPMPAVYKGKFKHLDINKTQTMLVVRFIFIVLISYEIVFNLLNNVL